MRTRVSYALLRALAGMEGAPLQMAHWNGSPRPTSCWSRADRPINLTEARRCGCGFGYHGRAAAVLVTFERFRGADDIRAYMAEYGGWNRKGAVLSDKTAQKEYGVTRDLIVSGIQTGKLEYREGAVWGNPYLRVLRSKLNSHMTEQLRSEYLSSKKATFSDAL